MGKERVLFQDIRPYETPRSLEALHGPSIGLLELPINVHWGPERIVDLGTAHGVEKACRTLVCEGTSGQQEDLLNADLLRRVWRDLILPARCRAVWEGRFPELVD